MVNNYIPNQGDIVLLNFNPIRGHEQKEFRPGIVISNNAFNKYTKMSLICPITSNEKEFPTHYTLKNTKEIHGSVLCEHIRSIDYKTRKVKYIEKATQEDLISVMTLMNACIEE